MAEGVDTSSYNTPLPTSFMDKAQKLQQMENNAIGIERSKIDLINTRYGHLMREMQSLGPEATADDLIRVGQNAVKQKLIKPDMFSTFVKSIPTDPAKIPAFVKETTSKLLDTHNAINFHYGTPSMINNGQQITPAVTSPKFGVKPTAAPIQIQMPPSTDVVSPEGTQKLGAQPPQTPEGTVQQQGGFPGQIQPAPKNNLPVQQPQPQTPRGPMQSQNPNFEPGLKQWNDDQKTAASLKQNVKPVIQALKMIDGLQTGPGTEQWTKAVAFLKANSILPTGGENDPTVVRQVVDKYLRRYVAQSSIAGRSDAAQLLSEESSPNAGIQINPALVKIARNAVALDRLVASKPNAFQSKEYDKYQEHSSKFPGQMDERAFSLDLMPAKERQDYVQDMAKKAKDPEAEGHTDAIRFFNTLKTIKEKGLLE